MIKNRTTLVIVASTKKCLKNIRKFERDISKNKNIKIEPYEHILIIRTLDVSSIIEKIRNLFKVNCLIFLQKKKSKEKSTTRKIKKFHLIEINFEGIGLKTRKWAKQKLFRSMFFRITPRVYIIPSISEKRYKQLKYIESPHLTVSMIRKRGVKIKIIPSLVPFDEFVDSEVNRIISELIKKEVEIIVSKAKKIKEDFKQRKNISESMKKIKRLYRILRILKDKGVMCKRITGEDYKNIYNRAYVYLTRIKKDIETIGEGI